MMSWPSLVLLGSAGLFGLSVAVAQPVAAPSAPAAEWKWPERMANAKVLPASTTAEQLQTQMKRFTAALGVRCIHCHVGTEGKSLASYDFASDAKPQKDIARAMMRLTFRLNTQDMPAIAGLPAREPGTRRVTCFTCHRGAATPVTEPPAAAPASAPAAKAGTERGAA